MSEQSTTPSPSKIADQELEIKAECRLATDTNIYSPAVACGISSEGVHLISARRFGGGAMLTVRLIVPESDTAIIKRAKVRYVRPEGDNQWLHSCAFMKTLQEEELRALRGSPRL